MLDKLLKISGTAALYGCASMFLATALLGLYLKYTWQIDRTKWLKMLAVAQGLELVQMQKAAEERVADIAFDDVLERRAKRLREEEFQRVMTEQQQAAPPPPVEEPKPALPPVENESAKIGAFEKRVKEYQEKARAEGLAEETRLLENAEPEQAKEVIRRLWKDGAYQRVLQMLLAMEEKRRGEILYTMQADEELKDLCDILQRIGNGEPMSAVIDDAAKEKQ
jgi:hypothetical protein